MANYNKITVNNKVVLDLSSDQVTEDKVLSGVTFHDAAGEAKTGTYVPSTGTDTSDATATAEDIMLDKTAYTADGKVTGTFTITEELSEQDDLIAQIQIALEGKASGGNGGSGGDDMLKSYLEGTITNLNNNAEYVAPYICSHNEFLETVNLPNVTTIDTGAFLSCGNLTTVTMPSVEYIESEAFRNSSQLTIGDFSSLSGLSYTVFSGTNLKALILRSTSVVLNLVDPNSFDNTPISDGDGYIYVPRSMLNSYQTNTTWSNYVDNLRALEDYTSDGSITGEFIPPFGNDIIVQIIYATTTGETEFVGEMTVAEGMTWGEFLSSTYNGDGRFALSDDGIIVYTDVFCVWNVPENRLALLTDIIATSESDFVGITSIEQLDLFG